MYQSSCQEALAREPQGAPGDPSDLGFRGPKRPAHQSNICSSIEPENIIVIGWPNAEGAAIHRRPTGADQIPTATRQLGRPIINDPEREKERRKWREKKRRQRAARKQLSLATDQMNSESTGSANAGAIPTADR